MRRCLHERIPGHARPCEDPHVVIGDLLAGSRAPQRPQECAPAGRGQCGRIQQRGVDEIAEVVEKLQRSPTPPRRGEIGTEQGHVMHRIAVAIDGVVEHAWRVELRIAQIRVGLRLARFLREPSRSTTECRSTVGAERQLKSRIVGEGVSAGGDQIAEVQGVRRTPVLPPAD